MSSLNRTARAPRMTANHEGLSVHTISAEKQLRRLFYANMLWEDQFYIDGKSSVDILKSVISCRP
jgi:hypothetical protein